MSSVFNEQILAEKLSKLNNTQQCIETLSHWCIFHRSKAELVVATWDKQFHRAGMVEKVPLLYLANDILQNSKRKGNEFVSEFWKVLPSALKEMAEKGDGHGKIVVSRLVGIWEERRVFGSHAKNLKDVMLGDELPAPLEFKRKRSRSVKIFKRDSRSMRTKLTIGGTPEKIVTAFHLVLSEHRSEDDEMTKCKSAISRLRKMEEEIEAALDKKKDPKRKILAKELEEKESILKQSVEKLKVVEANRVALVSQLREALHEQESELESVRTQMQVAQAHVEEAGNMRKHLDDENYVSTNSTTKFGQTSKKPTAAEVADMLTSSSSSQYIMTSVLSTFALEEAKNAGLTKSSSTPTTTTTTTLAMPNNNVASSSSSLSSEQMRVDPNVVMAANNHHLPQNNIYQIPSATMHGQIPPNSQMSYHQSLTNPTSQHYLQQPSGAVVSSYGYGNLPSMPTAPPPPAPLSYMVSPAVSTQQSSQITQQQQQQQPHNVGNNQFSILNQQQLGSVPQFPAPGFRPLYPMPPPGMVYYAHPHQSQ